MIEEPIGHGGMAEVYRGRQRTLGRPVAVKVMLPTIARDKKMAQRFRRESRTLAALCHENIVAVHDLVEKNQQTFMVLEYVEGVDAGELVRGGQPLPLDIALIIATSVARALEHAHFRRIIHRDIKPANVMISRQGEVKLTDFGLAKDLEETDITRTGHVVGTPSYLAPELLRGQRADRRTDLYAVGVLLFHLLTGKKPFSGEDTQTLAAAILKGRRDKVSTLAPSCPRAVEKIVDRCLERDIDARYQRAAELRKDLEQQLGAVCNGNPTARLVGFLYTRGHAEPADLATLDIGELASADPSIDLTAIETAPDGNSIDIDLDTDEPTPTSAGRRRTKVLAAALALIAASALVTYAIAPTETAAALDHALHWATALFH